MQYYSAFLEFNLGSLKRSQFYLPASYCAYANTSAFFLAEKTYNKDLEIPPCRLIQIFATQKLL